MAAAKYIIVFIAVHFVAHVDGQVGDAKCRGISRGKDFVVGFTNNIEGPSQELHILVVAFSDFPTTVTISSRYQVNGANYQVTFKLPPRGYRRTTIPIEFRLGDSSRRSDKVLVVTASSEVTVYGMNYREFSTDAFLALPNNQLGNHHVVVSVRTTQTTSAAPLLAVVGLVDKTNVYLTLTAAASFEGQDYVAGDVLSFEVDRHEIVQIISDANTDLSGTIIRSDSAVAAISGHQCAATAGSTCDTLIEQLIPVASWGKSHIFTAAGGSSDLSTYKIAAFIEDTVVTVPGMGNRILNAGEIWEVSMSGSGVISSTLPSSVTQILRFINGELVDPSIIQVPSEEQFAFKFGFATPPKSGGDDSGFFNYVNIVVKADECSTVTLNGQRIQCDRRAVEIPGTEYVVLTENLRKGEGAYFVEQGASESMSPMSVIVYGYEDDETYGYAAGLSLPNEGKLLGVYPFIVSENGGDVLTTTLPCIAQNSPDLHNATCRFRYGSSFRDVMGVLNDFDRVYCPTFIFDHIGFTSIDVSLDGGETFPYSDTIYVASQYVLPSRLAVKDLTEGADFLDLTMDGSLLTIVWDPVTFPNTTYVEISVIVEDQMAVSGWSDEIVLVSQVVNNGEYELKRALLERSKVIFKHSDSSIVGTVFFVSPQESDRFKRGIFDGLKNLIVKISFQINLIFIVEPFYPKCVHWLDEMEKGFQRLSNLPPCPPNLNQARADGRYSESNDGINIYHRGAVGCLRRDATNGAGTQCCYNHRGRLLLGPPGGGTADAYAPGISEFIRHIKYDVNPWIACCYLSTDYKDCEQYYHFRPAIDSEGYNAPTPARGTGDPHFITLDQHEYTFNAAGECMLLQSELHNITFQGRMEPIPGLNASVFSAFVLYGESLPKLQIQRSSLNQTLLLLDNKELQVVHEGITLPKLAFSGGAELEINADQTRVVVRLPSGLTIRFTISPNMMSYTVDIDAKFYGQTRGLLGNFNGDPSDDFTLPNGNVLPINSSLREIHYEFGLKWMLNKSESIFTYILSEDFEFYNKASFVPNLKSPDPNEIGEEIIEICGSNLQCLYDAVNTRSLVFANETLSDFEEYHEKREILQRIVNCKFPKDVVNGKVKNVVYYVNSSYEFECQGGFYLVGNGSLFCNENGNWTGVITSCVEIKNCSTPHQFMNNEFSDTIYYGNNSYTFTCNQGFWLNGTDTALCDRDGHWATNTPSCVRLESCIIPPEFENGDIGNNTYYGNSSYAFSCKQGFSLRGIEMVHCDENGKWISEFPSCVSYGLIVGLSSAATISIIISVVLIFCLKKLFCSTKNVV